MKILLASAKLDDIRWALDHGMVDGIVTTPAMLAAETDGGDERGLLEEICRLAGMPVHAGVGSVHESEIYQDGRDLSRISDHVVVDIPLIEDGIGAMHRLHADGVRVTATLVFSAAQALLANKVGASHVSTPLEQLESAALDPLGTIAEIHAVFEADAVECATLAYLPRDATQFVACAVAGADAACVTPAVLRSLLVHPLTDRGLDQFLTELSRRPRSRVIA